MGGFILNGVAGRLLERCDDGLAFQLRGCTRVGHPGTVWRRECEKTRRTIMISGVKNRAFA